MYLTALTHRDQLFEITSRWLAGRVLPEDGGELTEIFAFEGLITTPTLRGLVRDLGRLTAAGPLHLERVWSKDAVRQAIVAAATEPSPRVAELVASFRERPEEFFPHTPVCMSLITSSSGRLLALMRRKRLRRIADKVSRRIADHLASAIADVARWLAAERAAAAGIDLWHLYSSPQTMADEFERSERVVAERFRTEEITLDPARQRIDDVLGIKMIGGEEELARIESALADRPGLEVVSHKVHNGNYRATHYAVELALPPAGAIVDRMRGADWSFAAGRGLSGEELAARFPGYVEGGARSFVVQVILTTFEDLVESELGRSLHEARILEQRGQSYSGRIAQNASFIVEYLLRLAVSPTVHVSEVPFKMWGRYLSETVSRAVGRLSGEEPTEWLLPPESSRLVL